MASKLVRSSKYRHVYTETPKPEQSWSSIRFSTSTGENHHVKASAKYFGVALNGAGGPLAIQRLDQPNRYTPNSCPIFCGHHGNLLDFDWNPFDDSMVATASDDTTVKVWQIDEEAEWKGSTITEPLVDLDAHSRKVSMLRFHPTAANVIGSASTDLTCKVWDIEKAEEMSVFKGLKDIPQDMAWDCRGDQFAISSKDKKVTIFDGRSSTVIHSFEAHAGTKSTKLTYLDDGDHRILTVGFNKPSGRAFKIWDMRDTTTPIYTEDIDQAAGVITPLYERDSKILYLCGKGDGNIRYYEHAPEQKTPMPKIGDFRTSISCRGICMVPKRAMKVGMNETTRLLKLTSDGVQPLSFIVPRKSDTYQEDLYPDCPAPLPAHTSDEWLGGSSAKPMTMSLDPKKNGGSGTTTKKFKMRGVKELQKELDEASARIKFLEGKLAEAGVSY